MDALIYFALWAAMFFLVMRLGCGAHVTGHGHGAHDGQTRTFGAAPVRRLTIPEQATDPVCGKRVRTRNAKPTVHDGQVYWLCSRDCREMFEAAPDLYLLPKTDTKPVLEASDA